MWLTVQHRKVQRLHEVTDAEIRAEGAGDGFIPYEQLRREWQEGWDRRHPRAGDQWGSNPWLWAITFSIKPRG